MKHLNLAAIAAAVVLASSLPAFAQSTDTPRIDRREINQQKRIADGVASGQLTPRETKRLEKGERHILKAEQAAKADGVVTPQERRRLTRMEDRQSRRIYKEKHDAQHQ